MAKQAERLRKLLLRKVRPSKAAAEGFEVLRPWKAAAGVLKVLRGAQNVPRSSFEAQ